LTHEASTQQQAHPNEGKKITLLHSLDQQKNRGATDHAIWKYASSFLNLW
jgi:hypothetical protein